ncbi:MAG: CoA transferase [Alphaproteobacteria bacterium]|nr:CoA transferase [Alphaproteobacteria bacterium]
MPHRPASQALARFTVLDLTRARAGPSAVRQLADWGANVIKIELPAGAGEGDPMEDYRDKGDYLNLHRNKRSITLNLKETEGRAVFQRLAERADVVVENFRPDVKQRLGIDYETLRAINPRLVYASISGFGQDGPYRERPGLDQIAQGMGGLMSITGEPGGPPMRAGIAISDVASGIYCACGILVALLEREQSGQGQWVATSLLQAQIHMLDFQAARWLVDGDVPEPAGNDHPTSAPVGVFETADGMINLAAVGNKGFGRFCQELGAPELIDDPRFSTVPARVKNRRALHEEINRRLRDHDTQTWVTRFNRAGVPCGPIYRMDQVFADPQVRHLGIAQSVATDSGAALTLVGQPVSLSRTPSSIRVPPPAKGRDTDEVLREFGFAPAEIAALRTKKVL